MSLLFSIDYFIVIGPEFKGEGTDKFGFFKRLSQNYLISKNCYFILSLINILLFTPVIIFDIVFFIILIKLIIEHTQLIF